MGQAAGLRAAVERLHAGEQAKVVQDDAVRWLGAQPAGQRFDIAFVDPPFAGDLWQPALQALVPRLAPDGWLYLESPPDRVPPPPAGWTLHRQLRTAQAHAALYRGPGQGGADTLAVANPAP